MKCTQRLYLTADRKKLVPEGDKKAASLYAIPGDEIPGSAHELFGLVDGHLKGFDLEAQLAADRRAQEHQREKDEAEAKAKAEREAEAEKAKADAEEKAKAEAAEAAEKEAKPAEDKEDKGGADKGAGKSGENKDSAGDQVATSGEQV